MIYTYGFLNTPTTTLNLPPGIAGNLTLINHVNLTALIEFDVSWDAIQTDETLLMQAVLVHDRVLCEVYRQTVLLPLRFGTFFVSSAAVLTHLETHQAEYCQQLANFAGQAEYTLKLIPKLPPAGEISTSLTGKQYFLAKKQRYQTQQTFQTEQTQQIQHLHQLITQAYPHTIAGSAQAEGQRLYLLVPLNQASKLNQQLLEWQQISSHWELQLSEPLPPYHFVGEIADHDKK